MESKEKNEEVELSHYEILSIVSNKYTEEEAREIFGKVQKMVTDEGGKVALSDEWGKKRLAYPIKGFNHGYYFLAEFDVLAEKVNKINSQLRNSSEILRHQIIKKKLKTKEEIAEEKKVKEKVAAKKIEEMEKGEEKKEQEVKEKKDKKGKVDLEELDDKLDKILDTDNLV